MQWKHDLIARVDARIHAPPVALPAADLLDKQQARDLEYLRVKVSGTYRPGASVLVRAATELGTGYWAMAPLVTDAGESLWINRGFIPAGSTNQTAEATLPKGKIEVVGLLRPTEASGSLLQSNRPADDRWYSRDVVAFSKSRHIAGATGTVFIDAQTGTEAVTGTKAPVPGLTVVNFPDNHLGYALTWFALALMSAAGTVIVWRRAGRKAA